MRTYEKTLTAGEPAHLPVSGTFFILLESVADLSVTFNFYGTSATTDTATIPPGYWEEFPNQLRDMEVTSAITQTIKYGCSFGRAGVSTAEIITRQATTSDNLDPETLTTTAAMVLAAAAGRQRVIFTAPLTNAGAVALGGTSLTAVNACRWLDPGDTCEEIGAAPAAHYALAEVDGDSLCIEVAE